MFTKPRRWSPVELEFLKENKEKLSINQLTIALDRGRKAVQDKIDELNGRPPKPTSKKRSKIGKRNDINQFCRSAWEANFCRYLNSIGWFYKYEPMAYSFNQFGIKRGTTSYLPDFEVADDKGNTYLVEIKGMLNKQSMTATRRFKKYYPEQFAKLVAVVGRKGTKADNFYKSLGVPIFFYYDDLNKKFKDTIPNWE